MLRILPARPGTEADLIGWIITLIGCVLVISWLLDLRDDWQDPTVSNIVHDLRKCRDAAWLYLNARASETSLQIPSPSVNRIELLRPFLDDPEKYRSGQYAFRETPGGLWVGCNLRNRTDSFPLAFWIPRWLIRLIAAAGGHPSDKMDYRNCVRLARRAPEVGLYGTPGIDIPPSDIPERFYRSRDDAVWMQV